MVDKNRPAGFCSSVTYQRKFWLANQQRRLLPRRSQLAFYGSDGFRGSHCVQAGPSYQARRGHEGDHCRSRLDRNFRYISHTDLRTNSLNWSLMNVLGHTDAFREVMMFTSAIMAMWNVEPAQGTELKLPPKRRAAAVYGVKNDVRVRLTYRTLPASVNNNDDP